MATSAAYRTFRRVYSAGDHMAEFEVGQLQQARYSHLWALYSNEIYDDASVWAAYKSRYGLYRFVRSIYNPVRRLVDFYAGIVYPGVLTVDPESMPDGVLTAIPFADDTDPALLDAVAQLWQWSNWQSGKGIFVRYGAALGDVAVEVMDDPARGKVYTEIIWPQYIDDIELSPQGNVKSYAIEYDFYDDSSTRRRTYRKEVDAERIATYLDGNLHAYSEDMDPEYDNPYGFAPLVWCKHSDSGGKFGQPAIRNIAAVDELNSLASHMLDQDHKIMEAPILIAGENFAGFGTQTKGGSTHDEINETRGREKINILTSAPGASMETMQLPEGEAMARVQWLADEIEKTHPELTLYQRMREQSNVTGPGAERMSGDTAMYVMDARGNYDTQSVKLFQMAVAIAGWRASNGDWGPSLDPQQEKFAPFDLTSYQRGELDLQILPRPIIPMTPKEEVEYERMKLALESDQAGAQQGAQTMPQQIADRLRQATQQPQPVARVET